jgi:hypothetical protein
LSVRQCIGTGNLIGLDAADFVLVDAGPLEDISNTRRIHAVFLRGQYFSKDELSMMMGHLKSKTSRLDTLSNTFTYACEMNERSPDLEPEIRASEGNEA